MTSYFFPLKTFANYLQFDKIICRRIQLESVSKKKNKNNRCVLLDGYYYPPYFSLDYNIHLIPPHPLLFMSTEVLPMFGTCVFVMVPIHTPLGFSPMTPLQILGYLLLLPEFFFFLSSKFPPTLTPMNPSVPGNRPHKQGQALLKLCPVLFLKCEWF